MNMTKQTINRRSFLKKSAGLFGVGTAYLYGCAYTNAPVNEIPQKPIKKQVLACSDIHIGYNDINIDGIVFKNALNEIVNNIGTIDYAFSLGDLVQWGVNEEFQKYLSVRNASKIDQWYELAGNHEQYGIENYSKLINYHKAYAIIDGNLVWIMVSDESPAGYGEISENTYIWLKDTITKHQDKNIIMCTHQLVRDTVRPLSESHSYFDPDGKYVINGSTGILDTLRVDLWLNGHQHYFKYDPSIDIVTKTYPMGTTTFINVASLNFNYNTEESQSFIFYLNESSNEILAKRRIHDKEVFDEDSTVTIKLPYPIEFFTPYKEICQG